MNQFDDEYECFGCNRTFRSYVFSIDKEWERVEYGSDIPSIEVRQAEGLERYCSPECRTSRRHIVMTKEGVPIRYPGLGPLELCAKCLAPVNMAEFHLTYLESHEIHENNYLELWT